VTAGVALVLAALGVGWRAGVFSGFLAALSSTAIVTKLLSDRGRSQGRDAQAALGVLIFQDLAVVVMVLLVPLLAGPGGAEQGGSALAAAWALGKAGGIIALVLLLARRALPPVLEAVARTCSPDLFLLTVIAMCIGTAWLVGMAGVSVALGAFLAGLVVSESPHGQHAFAEMLPLQILFSATFFVSIGLLLDVGTMLANLPLVLGVAAAVVVLKTAATAGALRLAGEALPVAGGVGLLLAQVGEFSFVLERAGRDVGLAPLGMGATGSQAFIAASVILMALTPLFATLGERLGRRLAAAQAARAEATAPPPRPVEGAGELRDHVVVAGYGRAARGLVRVLRGSRIPFVIATLSPDGAREAEREGARVVRGDYAKRHILELLGVERAKLLVVPDDDPQMTHRVVAVARPLAPTTRIVARAATREEAAELEAAGADRAIATEVEVLVGLFDDVLRGYDVRSDEILAHEAALRRAGHGLFEPGVAPSVPCELTGDCFATRTLRIRAGMPVAGLTLAEAGFAERGLAVRRLAVGDASADEPGDAAVLAVGAEVTLAGPDEAFRASVDLFRAAGGSRAGARAPLVDVEREIAFAPASAEAAAACSHLERIRAVRPQTPGCAECLASGGRWVHLRVCLTCGHVGCCDSSPGRHATAHHRTSGHPVMGSLEPGETWGWCFVDEVTL
jgi:CPA2 family monovalent cation:H+ antiporter-2